MTIKLRLGQRLTNCRETSAQTERPLYFYRITKHLLKPNVPYISIG